jgi:hypothetical protein
MAKTRLNRHLREVLYKKVRDEVTLPELGAKEEKAYERAAAHLRTFLHKRWPEPDMEVLRRYDSVYKHSHVRLQIPGLGVTEFHFKQPYTYERPAHGSYYPLTADAKTNDAVCDWVAARDAHQKALGVIHHDYLELIRGSRYLEDIMAVWPEVVALKEAARSTSLIVLSDEVIERIRADVERRKANA